MGRDTTPEGPVLIEGNPDWASPMSTGDIREACSSLTCGSNFANSVSVSPKVGCPPSAFANGANAARTSG